MGFAMFMINISIHNRSVKKFDNWIQEMVVTLIEVGGPK
jgi:hypothetical protein